MKRTANEMEASDMADCVVFPSPAYVDGVATPEYRAAVDAAMCERMKQVVPVGSDGFFREPAADADIEQLRAKLPPRMFDGLMQIPGVCLAGSRAIPGVDHAKCNDFDFVVSSEPVRRIIVSHMEQLRPRTYASPVMNSVEISGACKMVFGMSLHTLCPEAAVALEKLRAFGGQSVENGIVSAIPPETLPGCPPIQFIDGTLFHVDAFCFDYVQCRVVWCKIKRKYFVERTRACIKAHLTRFITVINQERLYSLARLGSLLRKAAAKGFHLAGNVTDVCQLPIFIAVMNPQTSTTRVDRLLTGPPGEPDILEYIAPIVAPDLVRDVLPLPGSFFDLMKSRRHCPAMSVDYTSGARTHKASVFVGNALLPRAVAIVDHDGQWKLEGGNLEYSELEKCENVSDITGVSVSKAIRRAWEIEQKERAEERENMLREGLIKEDEIV